MLSCLAAAGYVGVQTGVEGITSTGGEGDSPEVSVDALPFNAIALLFLNLLMDSGAALALASEPPTEELLDRQPEGKRGILTGPMVRSIGVQSIYQVCLLVAVMQWSPMADFLLVSRQHVAGDLKSDSELESGSG